MGTKEDLGFYWTVTFQDNSVLSQFDINGEEVLWRNVEENVSPVKKIKITSSEEDETFEIDIGDGKIYTPSKTYTVLGTNPRYVYYRQNDVRMKVGNSGEILTPIVTHCLGIKTDTNEQVVEVFKGVGMKPKKVTFINKITNVTEDL